MVHLGADACIVGRSVEKTEAAAREIAKVRPGARVLGLGGVDVRNVSVPETLQWLGAIRTNTWEQFESVKAAAERCVKELGAIDYVV